MFIEPLIPAVPGLKLTTASRLDDEAVMKQPQMRPIRWMVMAAMALAGCQDAAGGFENVQRVVGRGAQAALAARPVVQAAALCC